MGGADTGNPDAALLAKIEQRRALLQGEEAMAEYVDGEREKVKVRQLSMSEVDGVQNLIGYFSAQAVVLNEVCSRPKGWSDGLTPESFERLYKLALEVNRPILLRKEKLSGLLLEVMVRKSKSPSETSTGGTSSPTLAER